MQEAQYGAPGVRELMGRIATEVKALRERKTTGGKKGAA